MNTKYLSPASMEELFACLGRMTPQSKIIGGGTDLIIKINSGRITPDALLYMGNIPGLREIMKVDDCVEIGAMADMTTVAESGLIPPSLAAIAQAAGTVGSVQIRNNGTVAGNVATASPAGDMAPPLFLHNAQVLIASPGGIRREPISGVITGSEKTSLKLMRPLSKSSYPSPRFPPGAAHF